MHIHPFVTVLYEEQSLCITSCLMENDQVWREIAIPGFPVKIIPAPFLFSSRFEFCNLMN